jgi:PAS domain S-box-containing protein
MTDGVAETEDSRILSVLKENPLGLSIKEISAAVGMSRNSIAKYLDVLTATGKLELRHVGNAKLYTLSQRVPVGNIINYARELIIILDKSLQIADASDSFCTFAGSSRQEVLHRRLSALPLPLLTPAEEQELVGLLNGGPSWKKEIRLVRGACEFFLDGRFIPTALQNGEPGITLILDDTTDKRRAEKAIREGDRLLHTIFQIPTVPCFFLDRNHKVVFWDRALEIMTGIKSEDVVGTSQHWRAFYPEERPCLADLLIDGDTEQIVAYYRGTCRRTPTADGGYECTEFFPAMKPEGKWLHATATLIRDSAGHLTGAMETVEDVTEKKKREFVVEQ